jgi:hypothetical protein
MRMRLGSRDCWGWNCPGNRYTRVERASTHPCLRRDLAGRSRIGSCLSGFRLSSGLAGLPRCGLPSWLVHPGLRLLPDRSGSAQRCARLANIYMTVCPTRYRYSGRTRPCGLLPGRHLPGSHRQSPSKFAASTIAASSVISNCMAITAGIPSVPDCGQLPRKDRCAPGPSQAFKSPIARSSIV